MRSRLSTFFVLVVLSGCGRIAYVLEPGPDGGSPPALETWDMEVGLDHVCAIRRAELYCWGAGEFGQLGLGDTASQTAPTRVGSEADWLSVALGEGHSCAFKQDGELYCWGVNDFGQLGLGDTTNRLEPTLIPHPEAGQAWTQVSGGGDHTCAIDRRGYLYCWGRSLEASHGLGGRTSDPDVLTPTRVTVPDETFQWATVSSGQGHTCGVGLDGTLYCWGRNTNLQLGLGPGQPIQLRVPTQEVTGAADWREVAAGQHHSCGLKTNGRIFCWGDGEQGELGYDFGGAVERLLDTPSPVGTRTDWVALDINWFHTCAIAQGGALFCWGRGIEGQLGAGTISPSDFPQAVVGGALYAGVGVGHFSTCGTDPQERLSCWGGNATGQLGLGHLERRNEPAAVTFP